MGAKTIARERATQLAFGMNARILLTTLPLLWAFTGAFALEPLRFEAEDWTSPKDAWRVNKHAEDHWNLWSTDKDAHKKWSEGVVLQSPRVMKDRATPGEGAPPLHTRITGIPKGRYDIEVKIGRTLGISLDGESWRPFSGGFLLEEHVIDDGVLEFWTDDRYAHEGNLGSGYLDYITLHPCREIVQKPKVQGWAKTRALERLNRGVTALATERGAYVGWRLLASDPDNVVFNIYRQEGDGKPQRLNRAPIFRTTDFVDSAPPKGKPLTYSVRAVIDGVEAAGPGDEETIADVSTPRPYKGLKLDGDYTFQKCAVADLDGDSDYDFVIKQPNANIDPWHKYWKPSPDTYKLEAYTQEGELLWRRDLGWAIERGAWYSPYVVHDLDGDGAAEVMVKVGEGDPRDNDGKVRSGSEWLAIWDGRTGRDLARAPWPSREGFGEGDRRYNYTSRNQLAVAYLDGKSPCVIALRGTYTTMKAEAYAFAQGKLQPLWTYSDADGGRKYRGQGAHSTQCADIDGDGRDEIILGSAVIDDNGSPLWTTGLGHPDHFYVGDLDPNRPGLEIYYGIETRKDRNGMCMVDAKTGEILWGYDQPTKHIHSIGLCADIDASSPGCEAYGADSANHKRLGDPWLWSADGKLLTRKIDLGFGIPVVHWDADAQRELVHKGHIRNYPEMDDLLRVEGKVTLVADLLGDWREELIVSSKGELRIYTTTIPAENRRVCLMQDAFYRLNVTMGSMGYTLCPVTSYAF